MKKIFVLGICLVFLQGTILAETGYKMVQNVIESGISITDRVPEGFYGTWRVVSVLSNTNSNEDFSKYSVDIWNLSKEYDVITLSNPISGAKASINVNDVKDATVRFEKVKVDGLEESTETPILTLSDNDNFFGTDRIEIKTYDKKGQLVSTEFVEYKVKAQKISGRSINDIFGF